MGGTLALRLHHAHGQVVMTLRHSGPGVTPELAGRIFQPFSAGSTRSGSGLGLAICLEITRALHGAISLDNRFDPAHPKAAIGLDATVYLPLAPPEPIYLK